MIKFSDGLYGERGTVYREEKKYNSTNLDCLKIPRLIIVTSFHRLTKLKDNLE